MRIALGCSALQQPRPLAVGLEHHVDQAVGTVWGFLCQAADAPTLRPLDLAVLGGDIAGDDVEQRALAAAVAADEADPRPLRNPDRGVLDQKPAGNADGQVVDDQHGVLYGGAHCAAQSLLRCARLGSDAGAFISQEVDMCLPGCQEAVRAAVSRRGFFKGAAAGGFTAAMVEPASAAKGVRTTRRFKAVVDLTHTMSPEFPTFFGVPGIELQKQFDFSKDGFNLNWWRIIEHAGTHLDAPIHFSANGATV